MKKKLIIIPAYNEEASILNTVEEVEACSDSFDYIVINDCSKDKTEEICEKYNINFVSLPVNLGIGGAVQTGYKYAMKYGYDYAVQIDADGQHDPQYLESMFEYMEKENLQMLIGSRFIKKEGFQSSNLRRAGIRYFTFLIKLLTGVVITDPTSGLRMVNRDVIALFSKEYPTDYPEPESVVAVIKNAMKVKEMPVIMRERSGGVSSISMKKSIYYMVKVTLAIIIERIRKN